MAKQDSFVEDSFLEDEEAPVQPPQPVRTEQDRARNRANAARVQRELEEEERLKSSGVQTAKDFGLNLLQEATFGGADEAMGFLGGEGVREEYLKELAAAQERSPWASGAGGLTGSVATGLIPGGQVGKGAQLGQLAGRDLVKQAAKLAMKQSALGAAQGGATGFLSATDQPGRDDSLGDRAVGGAVGTALGGVLGALPGAFTTAGMVGRRIKENLPGAIAEYRHTPSSPFNPVALMAGPKGAVVEAARTQRRPALAAAKELFKPLPGPEPVRAPRQGFGPAPEAIEAPAVGPEMGLTDRFGEAAPELPERVYSSRPQRNQPAIDAPEAEPQMSLQPTDLAEEGLLSKLPQESMQELLQGPMQSRSIPTPARIEQAPQTTTLGQSELVPTPDGPMTLDQLFNEPKYRDLVENLWPRIQPDDVSTAGMQSQVSRSMQQPTVAPPRVETVQHRPATPPPPAASLGLEELQAELAPVSRSTPSIFKTTGEMPPGMSLADLPNLLDPGTPAQKALQLVTEFGVTNEAALSRLSGLSPQEAKALVTQMRTGVSPR